MDATRQNQFLEYRRQAARPVVFLAEIFAGGLHVDEQGNLMPDRLPVLH